MNAKPKKISRLAIASLVTGIIFPIIVFPMLGIIFGVVALRKIREHQEVLRGRALAITGILLSSGSLLLGLLFLFALPEFMRFSCRSIQSEPKLILKGVYRSQLDNKAKNGHFAKTTEEIKGLEISGAPGRRYTIFFSNTEKILPDNPSPITEIPLGITPFTMEDSFRLFAVGRIPKSGAYVLDVWEIDEKGGLTNSMDGCL